MGGWVCLQRCQKRKRTLSPERVQKLERLGFEWGRK
ncbi:MAG: helicase associated domain-containing protein [Verrucomicrobiae bacterium]|nr:helicase associated domain-containing protein [Verrucomicrobiae bacterium]